MYLLDLKRGVEVKEFEELPNVKIGKDESSAVDILKAVRDEMNSRFKYLEDKGFKFIEPKRDKKDLIVVAIDEASVLYGKVKSNSINKDLVIEARELTDELAKLGRAAAIHLILATQKVTKETIDTKVQENIGGRMCFRMNNIQGSTTVLGNQKALKIPDIKGRGIWANGNKFTNIQAPYISDEEIKIMCEDIKNELKTKATNFQDMVFSASIEDIPKVNSDNGVITKKTK